MSDVLKDAKNLQEALGQAIGFASMCWDPKPEGVFASTVAEELVDELMNWIRDRYNLLPKENYIREYKSGWPPHNVMRHDLCRGVLMTDGPYAHCLQCDADCRPESPCECCSDLLAEEAWAKQNPK